MDIKEAIFDALHTSYNEVQKFKLIYDGQTRSLPEYFLTVNLCKKLFEWNESNGKYYRIEAEKKTSDLFSGCFRKDRLNDLSELFSNHQSITSMPNYRAFQEEIRKGKVDIALTSGIDDSDSISEHVIEIKAINPPKMRLQADFWRICCFINPEIEGFTNFLGKGYLTFLKHENCKNKIQTDYEFEKKRNNYKKRLQNQFEKICPKDVSFVIELKSIYEYSSKDLDDNLEDDFSERADRTYNAYSVIVEVSKKNEETTS